MDALLSYQQSFDVTVPVKEFHRKKTVEMKRRAEMNKKFEELNEMVVKDEKLKHELILTRTFELATQLKKESESPYVQGCSSGYKKIEDLTHSFITSLEIDEKENCIEEVRKILLKSRSAEGLSAKKPVDDVKPAKSKTQSKSELPPKEAHMRREQGRRDRLTAAYVNLTNFISENQLSNGKKLEKLQILNIMINYIQTTTGNQGLKTEEENMQFNNGRKIAEIVAKALVVEYFIGHQLLNFYSTSLEKFFEYQLNPLPLIGFPTFFNQNSVVNSPIQFNFPLITFPFLPSPFSFSTSLTPSTNFQTPEIDKENVPVKAISTIHRPWI